MFRFIFPHRRLSTLAVVSIFVGNLPWATTDEDLQELFSQYGEVKRAKIVIDRETNRSRGFGFVDMEEADAQKAIDAWNGQVYGARPLTVNLAQSRPARG
jgi:RNA recognition motif-containing protein